jgi:alkanesulfonate monooxygenase SsuD/methylene tetrahydromethanopterin reductase-like flavin-dependent oxidoreductase (luciferase family)
LFQAAASGTGLDFAARHAEVLLLGGFTASAARAHIAQVRQRLRAQGRTEDAIMFVVQAGVIVARTDEQVSSKLRKYHSLTSIEGMLVHSKADIDMQRYPRDKVIAGVLSEKALSAEPMLRRFRAEQTVGDALDVLEGLHEDRYFVAGTPDVVVNEIEKWVDEDGIDGINLRQYLTFETARDFVEL